MSNQKIHCLVMAGGKGTRLWPESTASKPKQYMKLFGDRSLIEETLCRFDGFIEPSNRYIVTIDEQKDLCLKLCENKFNPKGLILEPSGRNTAPCILLALAQMTNLGASDNDIVTIMASDHVILNVKGFQKTVKYAALVAEQSKNIVTIGINATFPHTGYGYIHRGESLHKENDQTAFKVNAFREKPNAETARGYIQSGEYFWNAGMFVSTIGVLLSEFEKHDPSLFAFYKKFKDNLNDKMKLAEIYNQTNQNSLDYAVMEKSSKVSVVPATFDWNDIGSWDALESIATKTDGNFIISSKYDDKKTYLKESSGNIIYCPDQFVAVSGVNDLIIVSNEKSLMIIPKKDSQKVKEIYQYLKDNKHLDLL